jgi:hypothetical protein
LLPMLPRNHHFYFQQLNRDISPTLLPPFAYASGNV